MSLACCARCSSRSCRSSAFHSKFKIENLELRRIVWPVVRPHVYSSRFGDTRSMKWLRQWRTRIFLIFAVMGPGFITANVDNDAGGIITYSQAGAQFGYALLWCV